MRFVLPAIVAAVLLVPAALWAQEQPATTATQQAPLTMAPAPVTSAPPASTAAPAQAVGEADGETHGERKGGGVRLPFGVRLNGKFDVAYERYGYTDKLSEGANALRNYHHFVFLSRHSGDDPFFITAEVVDQTFYEFGARIEREGLPFTATVRAGKILVPFGNDPLFHNEYGGLSGFDQRILPVVWAQHGASANLRAFAGEISFSNDMYAVQGYALDKPDAVLNLQSDFSPADDVRLGWGDRLGAGWGPVTAWYSAYFNSLDFSRMLFLQAFDAGVWRPTKIPVLRDLALTAGILRGDVSGGKTGQDYYVFGDYLQLRYYPVEWLYLQGRTGLATFDNRSGTYVDTDRLTNQDGSSHNVSIVYRRDGFSTELSHYWNTEKANEKKNDFLRVRVGYDF